MSREHFYSNHNNCMRSLPFIGISKQPQLFVYVLVGAGALSLTTSKTERGLNALPERLLNSEKCETGRKWE